MIVGKSSETVTLWANVVVYSYDADRIMMMACDTLSSSMRHRKCKLYVNKNGAEGRTFGVIV